MAVINTALAHNYNLLLTIFWEQRLCSNFREVIDFERFTQFHECNIRAATWVNLYPFEVLSRPPAELNRDTSIRVSCL